MVDPKRSAFQARVLPDGITPPPPPVLGLSSPACLMTLASTTHLVWPGGQSISPPQDAACQLSTQGIVAPGTLQTDPSNFSASQSEWELAMTDLKYSCSFRILPNEEIVIEPFHFTVSHLHS